MIFSYPKWLSASSSYLPLRRVHFLLYSQYISTLLTVCSIKARWCKPTFSPFVNFFFIKTCFSVHFKQCSVNFTWFEVLCHQKFDDRPIKAYMNSHKKYFWRLSWFLRCNNSKQCRAEIHGIISEEKCILLFPKEKILIFIEFPHEVFSCIKKQKKKNYEQGT